MAKDPLERVRQAVDAVTAAGLERYNAIADAVAKNYSKADVGRAAGITGQAVQMMLKGPAPKGPEVPFWGVRDDGLLTIAVATKVEAEKEASGPRGHVTATETIAAYETVRDLASRMGLNVNEREPIPPGGNVNLNRDGLVVICGPRLSPWVAQVLASDDMLRFAKDEHGWCLQDHEGTKRRSPLDNGGGGDLGYLGRLPRPDRRGDFLYLGGIHAPGTAGVAHYLAGNLPWLWTQVRTARFSALISCTLDPDRRVESSKLIAGPYLHER